MKKLFVLAVVLLSIFHVQAFSYTDFVAVKSDIKAYIDYTPITSYNVNGNTYVISEQLSSYGFNVVWNDAERTLKLSRTPLTTPIYNKSLYDSDSDPERSYYRIFETDIKTYLGDTEITGYNIGGQTVVQIDELAKYGHVVWNGNSREISVMIFENEITSIYNSSENKTDISAGSVYTGDYTKYNGQVNEKGEPHGIGYMTAVSSAAEAGVSYIKEDTILGYFSNGTPCGHIFIDRYLSAGKTGEDISVKFLGEASSSAAEENNFGKLSVPHHHMTDYTGTEVFPDNTLYTKGVWYEINSYRGQQGVTLRSWYDGAEYQSIFRTDSDEYGNITKIFEEQKQEN